MVRNHIRKVAESLGYNMSQVAKGTGMSKASLFRIWHGATEQISFETINKLCTFLKVEVGDLLEFVPDDQMTPEDYEELERRKEGVAKFNTYRKNSKKGKEE